MIISHKYKFIFIKTKKTAGTSIEIALSKFCGPRDIITPISPEDEAIRSKLGYPGPQNYRVPFHHYRRSDLLRWAMTRHRVDFYNHIDAQQIKSRVPDEIWNEYFKFCFERNPWDKVISWYYWSYPSEPRPTLSDFIQSGEANLVGGPGGFDLYTIHSNLAVDQVYRYERLIPAMTDLTERLGLPEVPELPNAKSGFRKDRRSYRQIFCREDRIRVAQVFAREIAFFGYTFSPPTPLASDAGAKPEGATTGPSHSI